MKVIFLDIDGVLNCKGSKSRCGFYVGIDSRKVKLLRQIVEATDAHIILSSTWRLGWCKNQLSSEFNGKLQHYMNNKLAKEHLHITDKTKQLRDRGEEIHTYLIEHPDIDKWVVIDDEIFNDFIEYGIMTHLVKTEFDDENGGLTQAHVDEAIKMLID